MMRRKTARFWGILALFFLGPVGADTLQVAVAASFESAFERLKTEFEQETRHQVLSSVGATGKFYAQIKAGAPFDVLLAADENTPKRLEVEGLGLSGTRFTYAVGRLVLWSLDPERVDSEGKVLASDSFAHLAIANPRTAPYGAAAIDVLKRMGRYEAIKSRLVEGESVAQAQQYVVSRNAELGFLALSQVFREGRLSSGSAWVVPEALHAPIQQQALLLKHGERNEAARAFLRFLGDKDRDQVLSSFGYVR